MSKAVSFYDWELAFRKKKETNNKNEKNSKTNGKKINSIGISESVFNSFIRSWQEKNLK